MSPAGLWKAVLLTPTPAVPRTRPAVAGVHRSKFEGAIKELSKLSCSQVIGVSDLLIKHMLYRQVT